ncbi:MAG TPA: hydantoinase B/oxoprolinase family protein, partial [Terriglobia bacterium]|nr:hydantoinase B/oxoprolinase family protein [Terriglobia bacterium]
MGLSEEIYQEGLRIPPVTLARGGEIQRDVRALVLQNVRTPREREGDLTAQVAACRLGERRLQEVTAKYGAGKMTFYLEAIERYSTQLMRAALQRIPEGAYTAEDALDDDGFSAHPVRLRVAIRIERGQAEVDFSGSSPQCRGSVNAVLAITTSAVFYVFRCLLGEDVPASAGLMAPITVHAPEGSVVNARPPAAVAAGNVETSQRIVDVLLRALSKALPHRIPAASSGTMNNVSFGCAGGAPHGSSTAEPFAYYETIAGGMGARPTSDGLSGVHTHMTNSLNTPIEALESAYPVRVRRYSLRRGSGGAGKFHGGDGIVREIEFLADVRGSILSDRRRFRPYGLKDGSPGAPGRNTLIFPSLRGRRGRTLRLASKAVFEAPRGSILRIETPSGGGWGRAGARSQKTEVRSEKLGVMQSPEPAL